MIAKIELKEETIKKILAKSFKVEQNQVEFIVDRKFVGSGDKEHVEYSVDATISVNFPTTFDE